MLEGRRLQRPRAQAVQIYPKHDRPARGPCIATLGDTIELRVERLVDWLIELKQKNLISLTEELFGFAERSLCSY